MHEQRSDEAAAPSEAAAFSLADGVTVGEVLGQAERALETVDPDTARLDAEVLLAHALDVSRADLLARLRKPLPAGARATFENLINRRLQHEPVAYLTQHKEFYGLDFYVDHRVLIPRPETEVLVERSIAIAETRSGSPNSPFTIADVGTGSGCIAVALAASLPQAQIHATEASYDALEVARINVERHGVGERVHLVQSDLLGQVAPELCFGLIVANLPYVSVSELPELPRSVRDYEPVEQALEAGPDGLDLYRRLLDQAPPRLRRSGAVLFEIGWTQGAAATTLARQAFPDADVRVLPDLAGRDRVVEIRTQGD